MKSQKQHKRKLAKRKVAKRKAVKRKANKQLALVTELRGVSDGEWVWCLHCGRCYRVGEHRNGRDGLEYCHYQDCDGDAVFDAWSWEVMHETHADYPKEPERNKEYEL